MYSFRPMYHILDLIKYFFNKCFRYQHIVNLQLEAIEAMDLMTLEERKKHKDSLCEDVAVLIKSYWDDNTVPCPDEKMVCREKLAEGVVSFHARHWKQNTIQHLFDGYIDLVKRKKIHKKYLISKTTFVSS